MRSLKLAATVAAVLGATASAFSTRRPFDGFVGRKTLRQWHDPARVEAATVKRELRKLRNLYLAQRGAYGRYWAAL